MSKLKTIREALQSNPNVVIIDLSEKTFPLEKGVVNLVNYFIAPRSGLYTVDELRNFMTNLIPGLEPTHKQDFEQGGNSIRLGRMYFDEKVGEKKQTLQKLSLWCMKRARVLIGSSLAKRPAKQVKSI